MKSTAPSPSKPNVLKAVEYEDLIKAGSPDEPAAEIEEEDLHTLFYTSGTTGKPKGAMLTQKSWANVAINLVLDYGPVTEKDVILNTQPMSHGAGFFVLPFFIKGATNVLIPDVKPSVIFETIQREKVTVLKLVPAGLYQLTESPEKTQYDLNSLHSIIYSGSPSAAPRLKDAIQFFGKKIAQLYGQAEAPVEFGRDARSSQTKLRKRKLSRRGLLPNQGGQGLGKEDQGKRKDTQEVSSHTPQA